MPANLGRIPNNVYVIPHGAKAVVAEDVPDVREAKRKAGYESKKVVLCIGWWEPNKRFEDVVTIWPDILEKAKNAVLIIAGDARPGSPSGLYYKPKLLNHSRISGKGPDTGHNWRVYAKGIRLNT